MEMVKTDLSINLGHFVTSFGDHPDYEGGSQILLKFPNGYGASIAYVPAGTQGIELQTFRYSGDWWEHVGRAVPYVDALQIYELLISIFSIPEGGGYVC